MSDRIFNLDRNGAGPWWSLPRDLAGKALGIPMSQAMWKDPDTQVTVTLLDLTDLCGDLVDAINSIKGSHPEDIAAARPNTVRRAAALAKSSPAGEQWVIAKEMAIEFEGERPMLGYALIQGTETFPSDDAAMEYLNLKQLPLGWVIVRLDQIITKSRASQDRPVQPSQSVIKAAVDKFLGWKLPQDFHPDCGISFTPVTLPPIGTNLFTAEQAKAMFEYCLQGAAFQPEQAEPVARLRFIELLNAEFTGGHRTAESLANSLSDALYGDLPK